MPASSFNYKTIAKKRANKGLGNTVYFVPTDRVETFGQINSTAATTAGATVTVDTDHEFAVGEGFRTAYTSQDFSQLNGETTGESGSRSIDWKAEVFIPGNDAELSEFANNAINEDFLFLAKDPNCENGQVMQLGTHCSPAKFTGKFTSGTIKDGKKGWMFEVEYTGALLFYTGDITIKA